MLFGYNLIKTLGLISFRGQTHILPIPVFTGFRYHLHIFSDLFNNVEKIKSYEASFKTQLHDNLKSMFEQSYYENCIGVTTNIKSLK